MIELVDVRSRKKDWTRAEILAAAWQLVAREGIAALSLRELAASVGMRAPSLYTYFPSKNDLYDAMYAHGMRAFAERMSNAPPGRSPQETLRSLARTFVGTAVQDPFRYELLFQRPIPGFVPSAESLAIGLTGLAATRKAAEAAGLRGEPAFDLFMATMRGLAGMQIANDPGGDRWVRLADEAVDILVAHCARAASAPQRPARRTGPVTKRTSATTAGDLRTEKKEGTS
jgi:AcrR family transcriptional regulator